MTSRPYVICHMMASIDGRIDSAVTSVANAGEYEATGQALDGDAWVCGRTTMEQHFADGVVASKAGAPAGSRPVHVARKAESYAVAVDTTGKLLWAGGDLDGDHLICVVSERATDEVAVACARIAGWIRIVGHVTAVVIGSRVTWDRAPIIDQTNALWPCSSFQGWK